MSTFTKVHLYFYVVSLHFEWAWLHFAQVPLPLLLLLRAELSWEWKDRLAELELSRLSRAVCLKWAELTALAAIMTCQRKKEGTSGPYTVVWKDNIRWDTYLYEWRPHSSTELKRCICIQGRLGEAKQHWLVYTAARQPAQNDLYPLWRWDKVLVCFNPMF